MLLLAGRVSEIEIAGRNRTNRKSSVKKRPRVPMKAAQSKRVPWYIPHDEGRKSRCRLVTIMTKRSSHMPTLTTIEMQNRNGTLRRRFLIQRRFGAITLHRMSDQYMYQYGPNMRFRTMKISYSFALYQAKNASIM